MEYVTHVQVFLFLNGAQEGDESAALLAAYTKDAKSFNPKNLIFLFAELDASTQALSVRSLLPFHLFCNTKLIVYSLKVINNENVWFRARCARAGNVSGTVCLVVL
jgi:hypothetical protein